MRTLNTLAWLLIGSVGTSSAALAQPIQALGIAGDSLSNEYFELGWYSSKSWPQILVEWRGINIGPTAPDAGLDNWGDLRWYGYQNNYARPGATTDNMALERSPEFLADAVLSRGVTHVVMAASGNDFASWNDFTYIAIYEGTWTQSRINAWADASIQNMRDSVKTVHDSGTKIVLLNMPDFGVMPFYQGYFPDPARRLLVTAAIRRVNDGLRLLAQELHIPLVDLFFLNQEIFGPADRLKDFLWIGGAQVLLQGADNGSSPLTGYVSDNIHFNTLIHALWANAIITALNSGYHTGIAVLSEQEMLDYVGVEGTGQSQLPLEIGPYSRFVVVGPCMADFNASGALSVQDIFDFIHAWFISDSRSDFDASGTIDAADIFSYLNAWMGGC